MALSTNSQEKDFKEEEEEGKDDRSDGEKIGEEESDE